MTEKKVQDRKARMTLASTKVKFMLDLPKCVSDWNGGVRYFVEEGE